MGSDLNIVLAGGSGYVGKLLIRDLKYRARNITVLSRSDRRIEHADSVRWNPKEPSDKPEPDDWQRTLDGADVVINLAGRSINCRYTEENRRAILESRLVSTRAVGDAIRRAANPPKLWINASSATIYEDSTTQDRDEASTELGEGFSEDVCKQWENVFFDSATPNTRRVAMRISIVFGPGKGTAFEIMHRLVRFGLGGTQGPGSQYVSWIHHRDCTRAIEWLIDHEELSGPVNLTAPHPVPNREFMKLFRKAGGMPIGLPAPTPLLKLGAIFLRTETELILKSRRVVPRKLLDSGFRFEFETPLDALQAIVAEATGKQT